MRVDVLLGEGHVATSDVTGRVVVVIDVLRAATTVAAALTNGARAVIPFGHPDEVALRAKSYERGEVKLAGERKMNRIPGFDLGNSPLEYTRDAVDGRTILFSTTNGTSALIASHGARACFFGALVNVSATISAMLAASEDGADCLIVCAGSEKRVALEDLVCAGMLVHGLEDAREGIELGDGALIAHTAASRYRGDMARLAADASHARTLAAAGFSADVNYCLEIDTVTVVVEYTDRMLVSAAAEHRQ